MSTFLNGDAAGWAALMFIENLVLLAFFGFRWLLKEGDARGAYNPPSPSSTEDIFKGKAHPVVPKLPPFNSSTGQ